MGDMKDLIVEVVSSDPVARKIARAQKLDKRLGELAAGAVVDDGIPPAAPVSPIVGLGVRSVIVTWAPPAPGDFVAYTVVTVESPPGTPVGTKTVSGSSGTITDLVAGTAYTVKLKHVDRWAHESGITTVAGTHTPTTTIPDQTISADKITAGALDVLMNVVVGGQVVAGRTKLSDQGLDVGVLSDSIFFAFTNDVDLDSRVSSSNAITGNRGTITWFNVAALERGMEIVQSTSETDQVASVLIAGWKGGTDITGVQNAYIYVSRTPAIDGGVGWIKLHGDVFFDRETTFERAPTANLPATLANHLTRRTDVDARIDALATALTLVTPSITTGWSAVAGNPVEVRRTANGWLSVSGRIRNTSGSAKTAGSNIWTNVVANRPGTPRTFGCARTDGSQVWINDGVVPVGVNANGDVINRANVGAGVDIDLSMIGYQVAV